MSTTGSNDVETYVAIADFQASEESNISLKAGEHVQVYMGLVTFVHI